MCKDAELIGNRTRGTRLAQTQHEHQAERQFQEMRYLTVGELGGAGQPALQRGEKGGEKK